MSLLAEIQESLLTEGSSIGPILLKLRFLANRLGSDVLEDWVRHETEGYPEGAEVPEYRTTSITYTGTFHGARQILNKLPVPNAIIRDNAGPQWITYEIRESISVIDQIIDRAEKGAQYSINVADLQLLLQDKILQDHTLIELRGIFSVDAFIRIQAAVRAKVLDLTLRLDRNVPDARSVVLTTKPGAVAPADTEKVSQVTQQTFYGPVTTINNSGTTGHVSVKLAQGDINGFVYSLVQHGIPESDAKEIAEIIRTEVPESPTEPLGTRAKNWVASKLKTGVGDAWKTGQAAAITEAIKQAAKAHFWLP